MSLSCFSKWNYCNKTQHPSCFKVRFLSCCSGSFQLSSVLAEAFCTPLAVCPECKKALYCSLYLHNNRVWTVSTLSLSSAPTADEAAGTCAADPWCLAGVGAVWVKARDFEGSFNWLWQQEMTSATGPGGCGLQVLRIGWMLHMLIYWRGRMITERPNYLDSVLCKRKANWYV